MLTVLGSGFCFSAMYFLHGFVSNVARATSRKTLGTFGHFDNGSTHDLVGPNANETGGLFHSRSGPFWMRSRYEGFTKWDGAALSWAADRISGQARFIRQSLARPCMIMHRHV